MSSLQKPRGYVSYSPSTQRTQGSFAGSLSGSETDISTSNENLSHEERYVIRHTERQEPQGQENRSLQESRNVQDCSSYNTLIIHGHGDEMWTNRLSSDQSSVQYKTGAPMACKDSSQSMRHVYTPSVREITDIPDDYLSQSQVLKHLAKEVKVVPLDNDCDVNESTLRRLPPPQYPCWSPPPQPMSKAASIKTKRVALSKSQPDLSRLSPPDRTPDNTTFRHTLGNIRKEQRSVQMVNLLLQENNSLKLELEACYQKVAKSQKLEQDIGKVHRAHEDLVASCERKERLERAAQQRLEGEVRMLKEQNQSLRDQCKMITSQLLTARAASPDHSRMELSKREALIAQLVTQNKELVAVKERQEIELAAQRATLQEQRTHIDILDTALTNAQANVVRLEEECRKKQVHVERVAQLQRALSSFQLASDKREQTERKLRLQLERELKNERERNSNAQDRSLMGEPGESLPELKRKLREKDEKIMRLEGEVAKWEQRYLEESELRQAAIDAASIPKDAKIAALEKTSQETEKLIAEARSDKLRSMDEVHAAQKKVTVLESRIKELESQLAERNAMIRVLHNKNTLDKEVSSSFPTISLTHHTPHPSLNTTDLSNVLSGEDLGPVSTTSVFSTASSALTSSTGFCSNSYTGSVDSSYHHKYSLGTQSFHKSLDDQLKELDSQLDSKLDSQLLSKVIQKYILLPIPPCGEFIIKHFTCSYLLGFRSV
uniref:Angiomotin C-terminal domain-containing protein n=1 Tax=Clastoptera arizonana TaxID=38151 RepID=A0A1B6CPM0_9HEMI